MYDKLVEVRVFEPQKTSSLGRFALDGIFSHPERYRYINCWIEERDGVSRCCVTGGEGWFSFPGGKCDRFWGAFRAEIVGEIERDRSMEADRFSPA